jgi:very-short-patch-repair endonuclease
MHHANQIIDRFSQAVGLLEKAGVLSSSEGNREAALAKIISSEFHRFVFTPQDCERLSEALGLLESRWQSLRDLFDLSKCSWTKVLTEDISFSTQKRLINLLKDQLYQIPSWVRFESTILEEGPSPITLFLKLALNGRVRSSDLKRCLTKTLYKQEIRKIWESDSTLRDFTPLFREMKIEEFRKRDRQSIRLAPQKIAKKIYEEAVPFSPNDKEAALLMSEADKKRNTLPVRKLFERIPELLFRLKPCLMMSPLSVSQFLPMQTEIFDAVVFDEASQIFSEEAIGALCRAKQFVVAGDSKQLPPTNFFHVLNRILEDDYDGEEKDVADSSDNYDSVLEEIQKIVGISRLNLQWHYRSKSESLIRFSNERFYNDRLITFPEPFHYNEHLGVKHVYVPDGVYERGRSRKNEREAQKVVEIIFDHFAKRPSKSLGVIALNESQMEAIQDELNKKLLKNEKYRNYILEDRLQGFFVKNLENVQGDERDIIILSIGYGKNPEGKFSFNFGPINQHGGERRLNVAITRAREKMIVVSSVLSTDFSGTASVSEGLMVLREYLAFAERETLEHMRKFTGSEQREEIPTLEDDIAKEVEKWGYRVVRKIGNGSFRLDLAVMHPDVEGAYLLGIECDGPDYFAIKSTRDRERLHFEILHRLGWKIVRVWSPGWVQNKEDEKRKLRLAIEEALNNSKEAAKTGVEIRLKREGIQGG